MSFSHNNPMLLGNKTARDIISMAPQSSRRSNKSSSRQDSITRKPSTSAGRRTNSKDKSTSFTNSSFLNNSQMDNPRSSSQNAHYQETQLSSYINHAFNQERRQTTTTLQSSLALQMQRKENRSPITSRPASRFEDQQKKSLVEVHLNKTKSLEEFRQREFQYLMRIAGLEKENGRIKMQMQKTQNLNQRSTLWEQDQMEKNIQRLQFEKDQLQSEVIQLKDGLTLLKDNLSAQLAENAVLKKYVSTHTSKRSDSKSTRSNTIASVGSLSGYKHKQQIQEVNFSPGYLVALSIKNL